MLRAERAGGCSRTRHAHAPSLPGAHDDAQRRLSKRVKQLSKQERSDLDRHVEAGHAWLGGSLSPKFDEGLGVW